MDVASSGSYIACGFTSASDVGSSGSIILSYDATNTVRFANQISGTYSMSYIIECKYQGTGDSKFAFASYSYFTFGWGDAVTGVIEGHKAISLSTS